MPSDNFYGDYTILIKDFLCSPLHIPIRYVDIWNFQTLWPDLQFDHRFCCFWAILRILKRDYLDN